MWAQRSHKDVAEKNLIYLTINILDEENTEINLTDTELKVKSRSEDDNIEYAVDLEFYKEIDAAKSTRHRTDRGLFFVLRKKEPQQEYWPRLIKEKRRHPYIKTDFDKWVDEDEQDPRATEDFGMGGGLGDLGDQLDFSSLGKGGAGEDFSGLGDDNSPDMEEADLEEEEDKEEDKEDKEEDKEDDKEEDKDEEEKVIQEEKVAEIE